jgi:hypothetical protein
MWIRKMKSELNGRALVDISTMEPGTLFWSRNKRLVFIKGDGAHNGTVVWGTDYCNNTDYYPGLYCNDTLDNSLREPLSRGEFVTLTQE